MLLDGLSPDAKMIIEKKKTPDELYDLSNQFKHGTYPFPQSYRLSLYFMNKAFEEINLKNDDDVKENEDDDDDDDDEKEIDYVPICTEILLNQLKHINLLVYGQNAAVSPMIKALTLKQNFIKNQEEDDEMFDCYRIAGKGIFLYIPKDCDNISADEVLEFIDKKQDDKILMCIYCVSPSIQHNSNDAKIIQKFTRKVFTTVFVTSVEQKEVVTKLRKDIKGRVYKREKMPDVKKLRKSTLIFDVSLYPQNLHTHMIQEFVNIVPGLSII